MPLKLASRKNCPGCLMGMLKSRPIPTERQTESYTRDKKEFTATIFCKAHPSPPVEVLPHPAGHAASPAFLWAPQAFSVALVFIRRSGGQTVASEQ